MHQMKSHQKKSGIAVCALLLRVTQLAAFDLASGPPSHTRRTSVSTVGLKYASDALVTSPAEEKAANLGRFEVQIELPPTKQSTRRDIARERSRRNRLARLSQQQKLQKQQGMRKSAPLDSRIQVTQAANSRVHNEVNAPTGSSKLLTREEETRYAFDLRTMRSVIRLRDQMVREHESGMFIHPTEEEWAAACGYGTGERGIQQLRVVMHKGQEARTSLCASNVGLVTSIAKRHHASLKYATEAGNGVGTILTLNDMVQEGNLGLMEAAERFEPDRGFKFSTYAVWWIRQRILRSIRESSRTIRLPAHVHGMLQKIRRARVQIQQESGKTSVSHQELAAHLGVSVEKLCKYTESSRNVVSLEVPIAGSNGGMQGGSFKQDLRTLGDTLASDAPTPDEDAEAEYLRQDLWQVIKTELADLERDVILHRFGLALTAGGSLSTGKPKTVAQTAAALDISRDKVRLVEARALNKLRHPQKNYRLREYVMGGAGKGATRSPSASGGLKQQRRLQSLTSSNTIKQQQQPQDPVIPRSATSNTTPRTPTDSPFDVHFEGSSSKRRKVAMSASGVRSDRMWFF